jgi:hypothetical protein
MHEIGFFGIGFLNFDYNMTGFQFCLSPTLKSPVRMYIRAGFFQFKPSSFSKAPRIFKFKEFRNIYNYQYVRITDVNSLIRKDSYVLSLFFTCDSFGVVRNLMF